VELDTDEDTEEEYDSDEIKNIYQEEMEDEPEQENIYLDTPLEITQKKDDKEIEEDIYLNTKTSQTYSQKSDTTHVPKEKRELNVFEKFFAENLLLKV
jgi:hypothetical protein